MAILSQNFAQMLPVIINIRKMNNFSVVGGKMRSSCCCFLSYDINIFNFSG